MRYLVLALALVGCRTQPLAHPIDDTPLMSLDLGVPDLPRLRDLANPNGRTGCSQLNQCINDCGGSQRCQRDCYTMGSAEAQDAYQTAIQCLYDWCFNAQANRPARCVQDRNGQPRDPADMGVGGCQRCLENAFAELGGESCDPNSLDCKPQGCELQVQDCLSN